METSLNVADNSGAKSARCIKVLGGSDHMITGIADVVVVAITSAIPGGKVKKGDRIKFFTTNKDYEVNDNEDSFFKGGADLTSEDNKQNFLLFKIFNSNIFSYTIRRKINIAKYSSTFRKRSEHYVV